VKKVWDWCKREVVLCIAIVLAVVSAFFVHPDKGYMEYIDVRTLAILFCLMAVMAGLQKIGTFRFVAEKLLERVKNIKGLIFILVMLCFVFSMLITNDVALITFVPFTFIVLKMILDDKAEMLIVPIVVMQTIAANLGSMLTPIGNPQNLYLYGKSGISFVDFIILMLPYTAIAFVLLGIWCVILPYKGSKTCQLNLQEKTSLSSAKGPLLVYAGLFVFCILTVAHIIPYFITLLLVIIVLCIMDKEVLGKVDYSLLFTFVGFFVFVGNVGRIPEFHHFIQQIINGNEVVTSVVASQFMSNVPAALLLSRFTDKYSLLIVGTNLGGLGTLIASMASLISFKYIGKEYKNLRGKYLLCFTLSNLLFLAVFLMYVTLQ
jgi:Na+/H+ antiporter NhaD/arsenite permease-like protein